MEKEVKKEGYIINAFDTNGNQFSIDLKGNTTIVLAGENKRVRKIGQFVKTNNVINFFKTENESDTFIKTNAWSIPYALFKFIEGTINIRTEIGIYRISKEEAIQYGSFLHFKDSGYEQKYYIPKSYWQFERNTK